MAHSWQIWGVAQIDSCVGGGGVCWCVTACDKRAQEYSLHAKVRKYLNCTVRSTIRHNLYFSLVLLEYLYWYSKYAEDARLIIYLILVAIPGTLFIYFVIFCLQVLIHACCCAGKNLHHCFPGFSWAEPSEGGCRAGFEPGAAAVQQPGADYLYPCMQDFEPTGGGE